MRFVICTQLTDGTKLVVASRANDVVESGQFKLQAPGAVLMFNIGGWGGTVTVKSNKS